jgi:hypothetical protein
MPSPPQMRVEIAECQAPQVIDEFIHLPATGRYRKAMLERQSRRGRRVAFPVG